MKYWVLAPPDPAPPPFISEGEAPHRNCFNGSSLVQGYGSLVLSKALPADFIGNYPGSNSLYFPLIIRK